MVPYSKTILSPSIINIFSHFASFSSASFSVSRQCKSSMPTKASSSWWLKIILWLVCFSVVYGMSNDDYKDETEVI